MNDYDDMKDLTRPHYDDLPPMPLSDRAAQFSPFAALVGYDDAVAETERITDDRREMMEDEISILNDKFRNLEDNVEARPEVRVAFYVQDRHKAGGSYITKEGRIRLIDHYNNELVFTDGDKVPVADVYDIVML